MIVKGRLCLKPFKMHLHHKHPRQSIYICDIMFNDFEYCFLIVYILIHRMSYEEIERGVRVTFYKKLHTT